MSDTTVHQHYVWRYYLRQWATNEQIICLRDRNKIFPVNLMKIAQEKLFYQFCESSETDFLIARHMADDCSIKLIEVYKSINAFLRSARENGDNALYQDILEFCKDFDEKFYNCPVENALKLPLEQLYAKDFSFLDNQDTKIPFCNAIAEQYCRTNMMRTGFIRGIKESNIEGANPHNVWFLIRHSLACKIGMALAFKEYRFCLLESSGIPLITGDQPIINVYADYKEPKGIAEQCDLYYPITPQLALFITDKDIVENKGMISLSREQAAKLNDLIVNASLSQVFAANNDDLLKYKTT